MHGDSAHPLDGGLQYDLDNDVEILIRKMPDDPDGLSWSQLQAVVSGLWEYIVAGMRYHTVTFDILDIEHDAQIGWGHIVKWGWSSLSNGTAKRALQLSSPVPPSFANAISGQRNSSLPSPLSGPTVDWPVKDSDMTLRLSPIPGERVRRADLDPEAVRNLFVVLIEIIQDAMATQGQGAVLGGRSFRYGRLVVLRVINDPYMLTWGQFAEVVLGLIDYMVDHNHYRARYFTIFVQDPKVELAIGSIRNGNVQHENGAVARRRTVEGDGVR